MSQKQFPKISIVTPVFNQVDYIEATIQSVLNQNYPNLEYIIVDGGSTDGTLEVINTYKNSIYKCISEPDKGMYDALNKGFQLSTGEIMGWINSDDILLENSLLNSAQLFKDLEDVYWIQGMHNFIDLKGSISDTRQPKIFSLTRILSYDFKWIQQESTIWRRSLWEKAGGYIDASYKLAGDFELWFRFFQHEKLYNADLSIGGWRKRDGQLSGDHMEDYIKEVKTTIDACHKDKDQIKRLKKIRYYNRLIKAAKKLKIANLDALKKKRDTYLNLNDREIVFSDQQNRYIIK